MTKTDKPVIKENRDGTVCIAYEPKEVGLHEVIVQHKSDPVQGLRISAKINKTLFNLM